MASSSAQKPAPAPQYQTFVSGALAAMSGASASHPLDVLKVRLQVNETKGLSMTTVFRLIYREEGIRGLYRGLSASVTRQAVYSGARFGMYDVLNKQRARSLNGRPMPVYEKALTGMAAGGIGAFIATPIDITLVRMQADGSVADPAKRRNYKNVFDGLVRILREEGPLVWYRGCTPTCVRAMVITASQFAVYDGIKGLIVQDWRLMKEGVAAHLTSAFAAGCFASFTSTPLDTIKTRMQDAPKGKYSGMIDCAAKTIREPGGVFALYKGLTPTFVRQAPYVIVMFLTLEQLNAAFAKLNARQQAKSAQVA